MRTNAIAPADPAAIACGQRATPDCVAKARQFLLFAYFIGYKAGLTPITGYCDFFGSHGACGGPALLPVVTILGMDVGIALGGAVFTDRVDRRRRRRAVWATRSAQSWQQ